MQLNPRHWFDGMREKRIHLDYASATPVDREVKKAMEPYFSHIWANPSAIYEEGVHAHDTLEEQRTLLARMLHVRAEAITFTSGGTESNNLALIGVIEALHEAGREYADMEIVSTQIEHPSILETLAYLKKRGVGIVNVPVAEDGKISVENLTLSLTSKTVLVTYAYVNSEIGVIQDVKKISREIRAWNKKHNVHVVTHLDASQAPLWLPCTVDMLGVDLMTLDAGKCYGPKGIGVLVHLPTVPSKSLLYGGGQEAGLRPGTENVALIVGCVHALLRAQNGYVERNKRVSKLREYFFDQLAHNIPQAVVNGSRKDRVANNIHISIPGLDTEYAVIVLDYRGVAASTRSACGAYSTTGSHVVRAISQDESRSRATIRFTLGEDTKKVHIDRAVRILAEHVLRMVGT